MMSKVKRALRYRSLKKSMALHAAVSTDNLKELKKLIEQGIDLEVKDVYGRTPLMLAVQEGKSSMVKELLDASSKHVVEHADGYRMIFFAALQGDEEIISALRSKEEEGRVDSWIEKGKSLKLLVQEDESRYSSLERILRRGGTIKNETWQLLLMNAVVNKESSEEIKALINLGAKIGEKDKEGNTLLHIAVEKNNLELVRTLCECGLDKEAVDREENTSLRIAIKNRNFAMVQVLVELGANRNKIDGCFDDRDSRIGIFIESIQDKSWSCSENVNLMDKSDKSLKEAGAKKDKKSAQKGTGIGY